MSGYFVICARSLDGRTVYYGGGGFSLLRSNAWVMDETEAMYRRGLLVHDFPDCWIEQEGLHSLSESAYNLLREGAPRENAPQEPA